MYVPNPIPWVEGETLGENLASRGISRRQFLEFCGSLAAVLGLNSLMVPQLARALEAVRRPSVVWIQLQECTGCVESVLRTAEPTIGNLVLDLISLDYSHTLMAASGRRGRTGAAGLDAGQRRQVSPRGDRFDPPRGERDLHDDRRPDREGDPGGGGQGCRGGDRHRRVRPLGQRAGRPSQPHRRRRGIPGGQGQAGGEHRRLSPDRRRGHRHHHPLSHLQPAPRARCRGPSSLRLRRPDPRPVPPARQLRCRPVRRGVRRRGRAQGLVPV